MNQRRAATAPPVCPCGSGQTYPDCCGRWHNGDVPPPSAELLMRSRYSAYVLALEPYLLATWHASTRPSSLELQQAPARIHWLGLRVLRAQTQAPGRAVVEFVTRNRVGGASAVRSREISRFVREDGAWYYVDSVFPVAEASQ